MDQDQLHKETEARINLLAGEKLMFNLLGKLLYTVPEREWLQSLYTNDLFSEAPFASQHPDVIEGLELLRKWGNQSNGFSDADYQDLNVDNTRLFVGFGRVLAPLWESVHFTEERLVFQESTLEVRHWYRRFGLEPENLHKEPDDHIGLEMAFISYLADLMLQAFEIGDMEQGEAILQAQRQFANTHFLNWAPLWCEQVLQHANTDFYRGVALLTRGVAAELAHVLDLNLVEQPR